MYMYVMNDQCVEGHYISRVKGAARGPTAARNVMKCGSCIRRRVPKISIAMRSADFLDAARGPHFKNTIAADGPLSYYLLTV